MATRTRRNPNGNDAGRGYSALRQRVGERVERGDGAVAASDERVGAFRARAGRRVSIRRGRARDASGFPTVLRARDAASRLLDLFGVEGRVSRLVVGDISRGTDDFGEVSRGLASAGRGSEVPRHGALRLDEDGRRGDRDGGALARDSPDPGTGRLVRERVAGFSRRDNLSVNSFARQGLFNDRI